MYNIEKYIPIDAWNEIKATKFFKDKNGFLRDKDGSCPLGLICFILGDDDAPFVPGGKEFSNYLFEFGYIEEEQRAEVTTAAWIFILDWERGLVHFEKIQS